MRTQRILRRARGRTGRVVLAALAVSFTPGALAQTPIVTEDAKLLPSDGTVGDPLAVSERRTMADGSNWSLMATSSRGTRYGSVPFAPGFRWEVLPSGATVEGSSDSYGFSVR